MALKDSSVCKNATYIYGGIISNNISIEGFISGVPQTQLTSGKQLMIPETMKASPVPALPTTHPFSAKGLKYTLGPYTPTQPGVPQTQLMIAPPPESRVTDLIVYEYPVCLNSFPEEIKFTNEILKMFSNNFQEPQIWTSLTKSLNQSLNQEDVAIEDTRSEKNTSNSSVVAWASPKESLNQSLNQEDVAIEDTRSENNTSNSSVVVSAQNIMDFLSKQKFDKTHLLLFISLVISFVYGKKMNTKLHEKNKVEEDENKVEEVEEYENRDENRHENTHKFLSREIEKKFKKKNEYQNVLDELSKSNQETEEKKEKRVTKEKIETNRKTYNNFRDKGYSDEDIGVVVVIYEDIEYMKFSNEIAVNAQKTFIESLVEEYNTNCRNFEPLGIKEDDFKKIFGDRLKFDNKTQLSKLMAKIYNMMTYHFPKPLSSEKMAKQTLTLLNQAFEKFKNQENNLLGVENLTKALNYIAEKTKDLKSQSKNEAKINIIKMEQEIKNHNNKIDHLLFLHSKYNTDVETRIEKINDQLNISNENLKKLITKRERLSSEIISIDNHNFIIDDTESHMLIKRFDSRMSLSGSLLRYFKYQSKGGLLQVLRYVNSEKNAEIPIDEIHPNMIKTVKECFEVIRNNFKKSTPDKDKLKHFLSLSDNFGFRLLKNNILFPIEKTTEDMIKFLTIQNEVKPRMFTPNQFKSENLKNQDNGNIKTNVNLSILKELCFSLSFENRQKIKKAINEKAFEISSSSEEEEPSYYGKIDNDEITKIYELKKKVFFKKITVFNEEGNGNENETYFLRSTDQICCGGVNSLNDYITNKTYASPYTNNTDREITFKIDSNFININPGHSMKIEIKDDFVELSTNDRGHIANCSWSKITEKNIQFMRLKHKIDKEHFTAINKAGVTVQNDFDRNFGFAKDDISEYNIFETEEAALSFLDGFTKLKKNRNNLTLEFNGKSNTRKTLKLRKSNTRKTLKLRKSNKRKTRRLHKSNKRKTLRLR